MITLHHFSEPLWFFHRGGFETDWGVEQFDKYACFVCLLFLLHALNIIIFSLQIRATHRGASG